MTSELDRIITEWSGRSHKTLRELAERCARAGIVSGLARAEAICRDMADEHRAVLVACEEPVSPHMADACDACAESIKEAREDALGTPAGEGG